MGVAAGSIALAFEAVPSGWIVVSAGRRCSLINSGVSLGARGSPRLPWIRSPLASMSFLSAGGCTD